MSNRKCCVPGCVNSEGTKGCSLHKFPDPTKNKELFNTWVYSVGGDILELENEHIFKYRRVCHLHFEPKYWCRNNRLSHIAVPTQNMPGSSLSKFLPPGRMTLTSIQTPTSKPSTSKDSVVTPQLYPQRAVADIEMKEKIEPVAPQIYSQSREGVPQVKEKIDSVVTPQLYPQRSVADVEMKENIEPVAPQIYSQSREGVPQVKEKIDSVVTPQLYPQRAVADVEMKENIECNKMGSALVTRRKRVKRVAVTQEEHAIYEKLMRVTVKLSKCRNKIKKQTIKIKSLQNITNNPQFLQTLENLPSTAKILTLMQYRESKKRDKGRRFSLKEKIMALSLQKQSPKAYRFLRKMFVLPSRQTLIKLLQMADINPGINKNMFMQMKKATEKMKLEHKLCVVLFDEMSLKPNITYNERKDRVTGFVTNGETTSAEYADHAQVFMIRGLLKNYKQPVAYTFSQAATKGPELAKQLKNVIIELQNAGLIVVATVCDQSTNNVNCIKYLLQETKGTFLRKGEEFKENIVVINDQEIVPLYDPPHLMKCIRNNLISKHLMFVKDNETKVAKWAHIKSLHDENPGYKGIRLVPKLTEAHCNPTKIPRMKVKYATQLFSQTVAKNMGYLAEKGILHEEVKQTADLLLFFDELFDSVNGSFNNKKKHAKPLLGPVTPTSSHHKVWSEAKRTLKSMRFLNPNTKNSEYVPTIKNWIWTLEGIDLLLKKIHMKYGVTSVWLRHLNQDPLENFFGSIRSHGCRNVNPTPDQFEAAFATLVVNSLSSIHAPGANCEFDDCFMLLEVLITGGDSTKKPMHCELDNLPDTTITPLAEKNDPRQIGGLQYVSGYFVKSAKKKVFKRCDQCKKDLLSESELEYLKYREYANKKWLCCPSDSLINCVSTLQDINKAILKENLQKKFLKELIKTMVLLYNDFDFINCETHKDLLIEHLINISCRFFIYNYCREINNILSNKRECDDADDSFKLKAMKMAKKCLKRK